MLRKLKAWKKTRLWPRPAYVGVAEKAASRGQKALGSRRPRSRRSLRRRRRRRPRQAEAEAEWPQIRWVQRSTPTGCACTASSLCRDAQGARCGIPRPECLRLTHWSACFWLARPRAALRRYRSCSEGRYGCGQGICHALKAAVALVPEP